MKDVYNLELHEQIEIDEHVNEFEKFGMEGKSTIKITKVPNGWIYQMSEGVGVFVPETILYHL